VSPLHTGADPGPAGALQRRLWGTDPLGWAMFGEPHNAPLFDAVLDGVGVTAGSRLLDVGCGTGMALQLAHDRGASVAGVDVTPGLLQIAASRLPTADLWCADMMELPFVDGSFDAVVGINSFQFAADPRHALLEAARVTTPGGLVAVSMFAAPERSESTAIHLAMSALSPPARQSDHSPYALSAPGNLEAALTDAGLDVAAAGEVELSWSYQSVADAVRGLLSSAGATRAVEDAGHDAVRATIENALVRFTGSGGEVEMANVFRWVSARRPPR
jgi:ubiquinone/menaquinone biosynthesis C-methylase UbiE